MVQAQLLLLLAVGQAAEASSSLEQGIQLQQAGDHAGAMQHFEHTWRQQPTGDRSVLYYMANTAMALGRLHEAVSHFQLFLQNYPHVYDAYCNLGAGTSLHASVIALTSLVLQRCKT